jgi:hypothetical protein
LILDPYPILEERGVRMSKNGLSDRVLKNIESMKDVGGVPPVFEEVYEDRN